MRSCASAYAAAILALALALAGCAGLPVDDESRLGAAQEFEMQGRVYARYSDRAFSGSIRWRHALAADELWLGGPLGQTAAHILRDRTGVTLTTADQKTYRALDLESSMRDAMGWELPLADLSHYVTGQAPRGVAESAIMRDADGRLAAVTHNGWAVELTPAEQGPRPARLQMRKDTVEVRIVIDRLDPSMS